MEFRILGPLEVVEHGRGCALGGPRQRALLALLLTRANEVVSADRLIDELWREGRRQTAANALQYHVSQLRKSLGRPTSIVTQQPGYLLRVGPDELDLLRFERLVSEAQSASPERRGVDCSARRSRSGAARRSRTSQTSRSRRRRSSGSRSCGWAPSSGASRPISRSAGTPTSSASSRRSSVEHPSARAPSRAS